MEDLATEAIGFGVFASEVSRHVNDDFFDWFWWDYWHFSLRWISGSPEMFHGCRGCANVRIRRFQLGREQSLFTDVEALKAPQSFEQWMTVLRFFRIKLFHPGAQCGFDFFGIALA